MIPSMTSYARPELLASTEWLAENAGRPEVRVFDVRWRPDGTGRAVHAAGHIPGAAYLDWSSDLVDRENGAAVPLLAAPDQVASALGRAGVGDGVTLVVYDDTSSLYAARTWWSLRAYGFDATKILDGGFAAWTAEHRAVTQAPARHEPATFTPRAQLRVRLTTADVRGLIGAPDVVFLDARPPAEYRGSEGNAARLGHLPGAVNVPVAAMTEPGTQRFRGAPQLRAQFHRAGISGDVRLVCYDGSGVAAAKLAFVLELLGFSRVAVYDGGWAEWGNRLDLPIER